MPKPLRFGVTLPQIKRTWPEARDTAIELDALGYDSLWVCDHVYGIPAPNLPIFEAWTELAAVAAITKQAKLGTLVTPPFFRNPAILAKQIATIDHVAGGGRVIAGLGAGWFQAEFDGTGSPFPKRSRSNASWSSPRTRPPPARRSRRRARSTAATWGRRSRSTASGAIPQA